MNMSVFGFERKSTFKVRVKSNLMTRTRH